MGPILDRGWETSRWLNGGRNGLKGDAVWLKPDNLPQPWPHPPEKKPLLGS